MKRTFKKIGLVAFLAMTLVCFSAFGLNEKQGGTIEQPFIEIDCGFVNWDVDLVKGEQYDAMINTATRVVYIRIFSLLDAVPVDTALIEDGWQHWRFVMVGDVSDKGADIEACKMLADGFGHYYFRIN